ncbi:peptidoglycan-binding protein [Candidatus Gracilibacteria bacterium]|nr:peptidoglycan-binding protein [Candidatus Gracilibacteria bacterium]
MPATAVASPPAPAVTASPVAAVPTPDPNARVLSVQEPPLSGDDVLAVQQRLLDLGYRQLGARDGFYGPQTAAAVQTFQAVHGLEADGIVGPQTQAQLFAPTALNSDVIVPIVETALCQQHIVLGGSYGGAWFNNAATESLLRGGERYRLYGASGSAGETIGSAPTLDLEPPYNNQYVLSLDPPPADTALVALGGDWEVQPRLVQPIGDAATRSVAEAAVIDYLQGAGIAQPLLSDADRFEVQAVDLLNDGRPELLISATRFSGAAEAVDALPGDYSLVLLQTADEDVPQTLLVTATVYPDEEGASGNETEFTPRAEHRPPQTFDLNGDGQLELLVTSRYFESDTAVVYGLIQGQVVELLFAFCGV